jgi:SH3-like domain-containing protein
MKCYFPPFKVDPLNHIHYNLRVGPSRKLYIDWMSYKVNCVGRMHNLYDQTYLLDPNGEEGWYQSTRSQKVDCGPNNLQVPHNSTTQTTTMECYYKSIDPSKGLYKL